MASLARTLELVARADREAEDSTLRDGSPIPVHELPRAHVYAGSNRRFLPRVRGAFRARLVADGVTFAGVDLSAAGALCTGDVIVWPGNVIDLELLLEPESESEFEPAGAVAVRARVVEMVSYRGRIAMRLRFEEIAARGRARIATWMIRNLPVRERSL
jgi:hypothetical protein